jgi:hypothetical protein
MKKTLAALIISLALPAAACRAGDCCWSCGHCGSFSYGFRIKVCASGCLKWNPCGGPCCGGSAPSCSLGGCGSGGCGYGDFGGAPWYSYWPLEAHFQVPAPTNYPFWPSPMAPMAPQQSGYLPGAAPHAAAGWPAPYQTVGYFQNAPSYWYGN